MIKKLILLIITLASFQLAGEERSLSAIELLHAKFYEKKDSEVKAELVSLNKKELTPPEGIPTPDGGHYNLHKFLWNSKDGVECILMLFVSIQMAHGWIRHSALRRVRFSHENHQKQQET